MSMHNVITQLKAGNFINAIRAFREATGCSLKEAKDSVDVLRIYFDPSMAHMNPDQAKQEETKLEINKWIVSGETPEKRDDWKNDYLTEHSALTAAKSLCEEGFHNVIISRVITEAKTSYTIEL